MTAFEITREYATKLLCKVAKGEYHYSHLQEMFKSVCPKKWKRYNTLLEEYELTGDGYWAFDVFCKYIDEIKYGLEYLTNGKVRYVGTNDLKTFIIA